MSDANPSADKIRSMLAEANERLRKASAEYFDLLKKGLSSSQLPVADQAKQYAATCSAMSPRHSISAKTDSSQGHAGGSQSPVRIFPEQMRSLTDHARSLGESAMKAATGAFTPKS